MIPISLQQSMIWLLRPCESDAGNAFPSPNDPSPAACIAADGRRARADTIEAATATIRRAGWCAASAGVAARGNVWQAHSDRAAGSERQQLVQAHTSRDQPLHAG